MKAKVKNGGKNLWLKSLVYLLKQRPPTVIIVIYQLSLKKNHFYYSQKDLNQTISDFYLSSLTR